jgi:hypothetical protein
MQTDKADLCIVKLARAGVQWYGRPDIAHVVHILSQFVCVPTSVHFGHLLRVLRYLRGTSSQSLFYAHDTPL